MMFGALPLILPLMAFPTILFLLIILPSTYGYTLSKRNQMCFPPSPPLKPLLKIISKLKSSPYLLMVEGNLSNSKTFSLPLASLISSHHHILHNTMVLPNDGIVMLSKPVSPFFIKPHYLFPIGHMLFKLLSTS